MSFSKKFCAKSPFKSSGDEPSGSGVLQGFGEFDVVVTQEKLQKQVDELKEQLSKKETQEEAGPNEVGDYRKRYRGGPSGPSRG